MVLYGMFDQMPFSYSNLDYKIIRTSLKNSYMNQI